jgi:hypothetical protein
MSSRTLAVSGALLIAVLVPASAQAATIEPLKPCYVTAGTAAAPQAEGVNITAAGFTPNGQVTLTVDGQASPTPLQAGTAGELGGVPPVPAPFIKKGSRDFTVTLTDVTNPALTVTATAKTVALGVSVKPKRAKPAQKIRFRGSGFTADKAVYAHYVYKNKVRKTVRMARKSGECGSWSVRKAQIPVNDPGTGLWTVQFDQAKKYVNGTKGTLDSVFVRLGINVTLVRDRN